VEERGAYRKISCSCERFSSIPADLCSWRSIPQEASLWLEKRAALPVAKEIATCLSGVDCRKSAANLGEGENTAMLQSTALLHTILFAVGLTLLISLIEIVSKSKTGFQASCWNWYFLLYFVILTIGNSVAAIFSSMVLKLSSQLDFLSPFLNAFFGVFAFEGVMSNTNITFLDKGVLTIQDWIGKARDNAIAVAVERQARRQQQDRNKIASALVEVDEGKLDTYMDKHLGRKAFDSISAAAAKHGANAKLYKALEFATRDPNNAAAIVKDLKG
jgi:hypothetical protein